MVKTLQGPKEGGAGAGRALCACFLVLIARYRFWAAPQSQGNGCSRPRLCCAWVTKLSGHHDAYIRGSTTEGLLGTKLDEHVVQCMLLLGAASAASFAVSATSLAGSPHRPFLPLCNFGNPSTAASTCPHSCSLFTHNYLTILLCLCPPCTASTPPLTPAPHLLFTIRSCPSHHPCRVQIQQPL